MSTLNQFLAKLNKAEFNHSSESNLKLSGHLCGKEIEVQIVQKINTATELVDAGFCVQFVMYVRINGHIASFYGAESNGDNAVVLRYFFEKQNRIDEIERMTKRAERKEAENLFRSL